MEILNGLNFVLSIVIGLLLLVFLVVVHELGHAIVARRNGVIVEEFGVGFPPRAWSRKLKNGVLLTLNWLPLGGFVKLQGENDSANKKGDYGAANLWVKTKILFAGVAINWLVAVLIFTALAITGIPKIIDNQFTVGKDTTEVHQPVAISVVTAHSPAAAAGLQKGDQILRFAGQPLNDPADLSKFTKQNHGQTVEIIYKRDQVERTATVTLRDQATDGKGYLGVAADQSTVFRSTWSAPITGVALSGQLTWVTLQGLGSTVANLVSGVVEKVSLNDATRQDGGDKLSTVGSGVAGPIAILGIIFPSAREAGFSSLMLITAIISLTLAVMNTLPIPALDGGRWFVTVLFRVMKKPLKKSTEEKIHGTGFLILMGLVVLITLADVGKFTRL